MPKFDSKEEYLRWKQGKLQQGKEEPTPEKGQLTIDNNASNSSRSSVKVFYILPAILLILAILYFIAKPFDYSKGPAIVQNTNRKEDKIDARLSKPEQKTSVLTTVEKAEPGTSSVKLTIPEMVKQAKKAVVTIKTLRSLGSGFLISPFGKIVTNTHVVGKDQTVEVVFASGLSEKATVVMQGTIPLDIAILEINSSRSDYDYLELDDSSDCAEGTEVIAIGSPRGLSQTITKGIVSNCNRGDASGVHYIQTDASINHGNSGGPLIDNNGKVIAVNTLGIGGTGSGLNLSIAINMVKDFMAWKLTSLEEKFRREREENIRKLANYFKEDWEFELSQYESRLYNEVIKETYQMPQETPELWKAVWRNSVEPKKKPPAGFNSWEKWFETMAEGVIDYEITVERVINIIKIHFSG